MAKWNILLLEFEADVPLGKTLLQILGTNPDFRVAYRTCRELSIDEELSQIIPEQNPSLILLVLPHLPLSGLDSLLRTLRTEAASAPVVVVVDADQEQLIELARAGIADFIIPPLRNSEVLVRIRRLLNDVSQEEKTSRALTEKLGLQQLIGKSPAFLAEISKIPVIAKADISVMLSGETGTGKEMVGRAIHYLSSRASKSFVPVNCGAIPVELLESELFGHERGAFTGAAQARDGLIQEAEKGTLFLDEVDCLPQLAQVKLLRFLQSKEYRRLGSTKVVTGDVRIIAASNANLEESVAAGTLRRDLYYRLNVVPIGLPPLRERAHDICLLARHFLAKYSAQLDSPAVDFSPEAERKLMLYDWPGNVRELEHLIGRVVVLCNQKIIQEDHIIFSGKHDNLIQLSFREMKENVISQFETNYLQSLLLAYKGNISKAARAAQKERRTFWELIRKYKIDVEKFKVANIHESGNPWV
jgi:DNA-binding NtrC family response regulator